MNILPNQNTASVSKPNAVLATLTLTETSTLSSSESRLDQAKLPLEKAMHRRAEAMTDVLTEIMDRPMTPRFWGLNE